MPEAEMKTAVITVSTSVASGQGEDESGPKLAALLEEAGCQVTFSRSTLTPEEGLYQVVVEYSVEEVGRLALSLAEALCRSAIDDTPFDAQAALAQLQELAGESPRGGHARLGGARGVEDEGLFHAAAPFT